MLPVVSPVVISANDEQMFIVSHPYFSISPVMSLQTIQCTDRYKRIVGIVKIGNRNINKEKVVGGVNLRSFEIARYCGTREGGGWGPTPFVEPGNYSGEMTRCESSGDV